MSTIIGISGNRLMRGTAVFHGNHVSYTPQGFVNAMQQLSALPFVIPIDVPSQAAHYIAQIDKLLLTGGQDVSPLCYGEEPHEKLGETNQTRDQFELALIAEALKQQKPIFAVCRGMQLVNVALGGTLYQDLSQYATPIKHIQVPTLPQFATHTIQIEKDSALFPILGAQYEVNSYHHQAINQLAKTLTAIAWAPDGVIEAVNATNAPILGVQWHPELRFETAEKDAALFQYFVEKL